MTTLNVSAELCEQHGFCVALAPQLFRLEEGKPSEVIGEVTDDLVDLANEAELICPARAITVIP